MQRYGAPEPAYAPTTLSDRVTGLHAVYAVTAALYAREKTGQGQAIVVPMFEAMAQFILGDHMAGLTFEPPQGEAGYARLLTTHRKPYATADGMLCVLIYNDKHWRSFFAAIGEIGEAQGLAQDPRFATHGARAANIDAVYAEVARILRTRTTAQWQALLDAADVPHMPMNSPADLLTNPQLRATGFLHDSVHPTEGPMHAMAHPTRWSATRRPAPWHRRRNWASTPAPCWPRPATPPPRSTPCSRKTPATPPPENPHEPRHHPRPATACAPPRCPATSPPTTTTRTTSA